MSVDRTDYKVANLKSAEEVAKEVLEQNGTNANSLPRDKKIEQISHSPFSTVCATTPIINNKSDAYQSEAELEAAFIKQLTHQAYEYLPIHKQDDLIENLRCQLEDLNNFKFSDDEWQRFFKTYIASNNDGIKEKTKKIQEANSESFIRDDNTTFNIKLIDKRHIHNNKLQVINQYVAPGGTHENRYDVTILVNGLPLVHIELKSRGRALREAFNQIDRYQRESFWSESGLFEYIQLFVISNGTLTKYYSNTTREKHVKFNNSKAEGSVRVSSSYEFTSWWADRDNKRITDLVPFTSTFFAKNTILNILTKYCIFTTEEKLMVMRPYQIVATEAILYRIMLSENNKEMLGTLKAGGYIWHTTGSGKTLTSFKTAKLATNIDGVDKVLFVVDRKDLDYQTMREYDKFEKGAANATNSSAMLARQLEDKNEHGNYEKYNIIVTTIQKLSRFIDKHATHDVYNKHIVIIFDECHRGHFGKMHTQITKKFKKYHLFGFTGTPIFKENIGSGGNIHLKTTQQAFGDCLHTYNIVDAIHDQNVLPFHIEYHQTIKKSNCIVDEKVVDIDRKSAFMADRRIDNIVNYILDNYGTKTKVGHHYNYKARKLKGFNSLLCTDSIDMAKKYYMAFKRLQNKRLNMSLEEAKEQGRKKMFPDEILKVGIIYSFGINSDENNFGNMPDESFDIESLDLPSREFLDSAISDYNKMYSTNFDTSSKGFQNYYTDVSRRLKERDIDIVIVVNMFLTGFDAKTLNTLWVDKNLQMHGLIQAFSRTNRILNSVKNAGNIICFRNLEDEVNKAIALFGNKDAGGTIILKPYKEYLDEYNNRLDQLFDLVAPGEAPYGENAEVAFIKVFGAILRLKNILTTFDDFAIDNRLSPRAEQDYKSTYIELSKTYGPGNNGEVTKINEDLVFEMELIAQVDINIDYILMLVNKYKDKNNQDRVVEADIQRAVKSSPELRNKKDLIDAFVANVNERSDVYKEWQEYIKNKYSEELDALITEEHLKPEQTKKFMNYAMQNGHIIETGTAVIDLMERRVSRFAPNAAYTTNKQKVLEGLKKFCNRFYGLIHG